MKKLATLVLISTLATGAFAHSRVESTTPADGATIGAVPSEINVSFAAKIRLTRVEMTHGDHPSVQLDLGEQTKFDDVFTVPLQDMGEGSYRIEWRGLGVDGHAMQGAFTFTVD